MRYVLTILWIVIAVIAMIFALLNANVVPINYFFAQKLIYFPLLMVIILITGAALGIIALLPKLLRK